MMMRRFSPVLLFLSFFFPLQAEGRESDSLLVHLVRPGVVHRSIVDSRGPWVINILSIDLRRADIWIESAHANGSLRGREKTSTMAARGGGGDCVAVAALNAEFFDLNTGESVNNQVLGGEILRAVIPVAARDSGEAVVRSQVGFRYDNSPILGKFVFEGTVLWPGGKQTPLASVNVLRKRTPYVLVTAAWGSALSPDSFSAGASILPLRRLGQRSDTAFTIVAGEVQRGGVVSLSSERLALLTVLHPSVLDSLTLISGDTVALVLQFRPAAGRVRSLVGGIPWLVKDGKVISFEKGEMEGASIDFATRRHPRTGVGFSKDSSTAYFITVDGRQAASVGMSLAEFGDLMIRAGVYQGLNLDGGGSTTMVVDGAVVNSPSDAAGERPVANCLLLMERRRK
jgi:hypothetical protein